VSVDRIVRVNRAGAALTVEGEKRQALDSDGATAKFSMTGSLSVTSL